MGIDVIATITLLHALNEGTYSQKRLQEKTGVCNSSIGMWMRSLKRKGLIHIAEWHKHGKVWVPYYQWGYEEEDAPKPAPRTNSEHCRNYIVAKRLKQLHSSSVVINERK